MSYDVTEIKPIPVTDIGVQDEIRNATSDNSKLVCIEIDPANNRLLIVTESN